MKKVFILWINPIALAVSATLSFPTLRAKFLLNYPCYEYYLAAFVISTTLLSYLFGAWLPFLKVMKKGANDAKWQGFKEIVESVQREFPQYQFAVNVMVPETKFLFQIEPSKEDPKEKKFSWIGKTFAVAWHSGYLAHPKFKMTSNQGYAGKAFAAGQFHEKVHMGNMSQDELAIIHNFHPEQIQYLNDLYFVASYAIGSAVIGSKPIGVLNIESRLKTSLELSIDKGSSSSEPLNLERIQAVASRVKFLATVAFGKINKE